MLRLQSYAACCNLAMKPPQEQITASSAMALGATAEGRT